MADKLPTLYVTRMVRGKVEEDTFYHVREVYEPITGVYGILYGLDDVQATEFPVSSIIEINKQWGDDDEAE